MNPLWIILIVVAGLVYILSPWDFLPDIFPVAGRIDDIGLLVLLFYYLGTGRLPAFVSRAARWLFGGGGEGAGASAGKAETGGRRGPGRAGGGKKDPYAVLGLSPGASMEEIHDAYRRLAHQYHPDKVAHLGEELRELARQKFVEIQEAYEQLSGKSG